jgi:hypothetical protein
MKKLLTIIVFSFLWSENAYSSWIKISESSSIDLYYHTSSMFSQDNMHFVWLLLNQHEKENVGGMDYWSSKTQLKINCVNRKFKRETSLFYEKKMGTGKIVTSTSDPEILGSWASAVPNSNVETIILKICK